MQKFWNLSQPNVIDIFGEIDAQHDWFNEDSTTPKDFRNDLAQCGGDLTVRINSPGGDVFAACDMYTAIREYAQTHTVNVEITALAASAASVVAMAGDTVKMSPVAQLMIHLPWSVAVGNSAEMRKMADTLDTVAESIITAYQIKTGLERDKLRELMQDETYMTADCAVALGFADGVLEYCEPIAAMSRENIEANIERMKRQMEAAWAMSVDIGALFPSNAVIETIGDPKPVGEPDEKDSEEPVSDPQDADESKWLAYALALECM